MTIAAWTTATVLALLPFIKRERGAHLDAMKALVASTRDLSQRPVAPRLSAPFGYRPMRSAVVSGPGWRPPSVLIDVEQQITTAPTAANLHVLGVSYLLAGRDQDAVDLLQRAKAMEPDRGILNDLAAAYYDLGVKKKAAVDVAQSLDVSDAILVNASDDLVARFNRSLALEALENRPSALAAWREYLKFDPSSEWALEVREHIRRLSMPAPSSQWESLQTRLLRFDSSDRNNIASVAERFPLRCRRLVENVLLPHWARLQLQHNDDGSAPVLERISAIGTALERKFGDPTIADIARVILAASGEPPRRLELLVRGYLAYADARAATATDTARAAESYRASWKDLHDARSPSAYAAGLFAASQEFGHRRYGAALRLISEMKAEPALRRYGPLLGQILWTEGLVLIVSGRPHESLQRYREAVGEFNRGGETESAAAVDGLIAENLQALGDDDEAWNYRLRALPVLLAYADARRQQVAFNEAAEAAMQQGHLSAALGYQTSSVALIASAADEELAAYAYLGRSLILTRMKRYPPALADLSRAREHAQRVGDISIRKNTNADIDMAEALVRQDIAPSRSIELLTNALDYHHRGGYEFREAQLFLARGRAYERIDDSINARRDYSHAIMALETQRARVTDLRLRSVFFGRAEDAYTDLTASLVRAGEFDQALRVFDRSTERTLTEIIPKETSPFILDDGTVLAEVALLPDEVVAWTTRKSGTSVSRHPIQAARVDELIRSYERAIDTDSKSVPMIASDLYDILIRPLRLRAADHTITFITDRVLRRVPMASLYDRKRMRYLVEDHAIATAPSATAYRYCSGRRPRVRRAFDVVAIGNAKAATLGLGLSDLPGAERELRAIASQTQGRLELNKDATPSALLAAASENVIVHFAGHALVNEQDQARSALVLAPDGRDPSSALLYADRIASARLRAPLVVLSSCTTNSAYQTGAKGAVDVARAFLAAGVPTVVTSRWAVADNVSQDLLTQFTRQLRTLPPAEALRQAQLEMLHKHRAVHSWCAFEVIGAV